MYQHWPYWSHNHIKHHQHRIYHRYPLLIFINHELWAQATINCRIVNHYSEPSSTIHRLILHYCPSLRTIAHHSPLAVNHLQSVDREVNLALPICPDTSAFAILVRHATGWGDVTCIHTDVHSIFMYIMIFTHMRRICTYVCRKSCTQNHWGVHPRDHDGGA